MTRKLYTSQQPPIHRHILIIRSDVDGDWYERYLEHAPALSVSAFAEIPRAGHRGVYNIYRGCDVNDDQWQDALATLRGERPYERNSTQIAAIEAAGQRARERKAAKVAAICEQDAVDMQAEGSGW